MWPPGCSQMPETLVFEQHHASRPHDDARSGHVDGVGLLVERGHQRVERRQEPLDRYRLALVDRLTSRHIGPNPLMDLSSRISQI